MNAKQNGYVYTVSREAREAIPTHKAIKQAERKQRRELAKLYDIFDDGTDRFMESVYEHMYAC